MQPLVHLEMVDAHWGLCGDVTQDLKRQRTHGLDTAPRTDHPVIAPHLTTRGEWNNQYVLALQPMPAVPVKEELNALSRSEESLTCLKIGGARLTHRQHEQNHVGRQSKLDVTVVG